MTTETENAKPKQPRRWWRYSLRTFLVLVTLFCVWIGILSNRARTQKQAIEALVNRGSDVNFRFDYQYREMPTGELVSSENPYLQYPAWLREMVGPDYLRTVWNVSYFEGKSATAQDLEVIEAFSDLRRLNLVHSDQITDDDLQPIRKLRKLKTLILIATRIDGRGLEHISELPELKILALGNTKIDEENLKHVGKIRSLRTLYLEGVKVTGRGLMHLQSLPNLRYLDLSNTTITDDDLKLINNFPSLETLKLHECQFLTSKGLTWLKAQLPNLEVDYRPIYDIETFQFE